MFDYYELSLPVFENILYNISYSAASKKTITGSERIKQSNVDHENQKHNFFGVFKYLLIICVCVFYSLIIFKCKTSL